MAERHYRYFFAYAFEIDQSASAEKINDVNNNIARLIRKSWTGSLSERHFDIGTIIKNNAVPHPYRSTSTTTGPSPQSLDVW